MRTFEVLRRHAHVADEARHVETYARLLHESFQLANPIMPALERC